ncbi:hypothetical protein MPER_00809, partial [Moniliophthora perniciosa FA553]
VLRVMKGLNTRSIVVDNVDHQLPVFSTVSLSFVEHHHHVSALMKE